MQDWKKYEEAVFEECKFIYHGCEVMRNIHIQGVYSGRQRQVDILVQYKNGDKLIVDAKQYNKKVDIKTVESFIGMVKDCGGKYGLLISEKGFSKTAINRAHLGENNIEVDILCLDELQQFQGGSALAYAGENGLVIPAPFGWVIDIQRQPASIATFYRIGHKTVLEAMTNKEWAYLNFWTKEDNVNTVQALINFQNKYLQEAYKGCEISIAQDGNIWIRKCNIKTRSVIEVTLFREFNDFIAFIVLYAHDNMLQRDITKITQILLSAVPLKVDHESIKK